MKSLIKTSALSFLTVSSLSLTVIPQSQAFSSQLKPTIFPINKTIDHPQSQLEVELSKSQVSKGELVASSMYCETNVSNGIAVSCCVDSYGNWACAY